MTPLITTLEFFIVFLSIAVIVYPDKALVMTLGRKGRVFTWLHVITVEIVTIPIFVYTMTLLPVLYRHLGKFYPVVSLGVLAIIRLVHWLVTLFSLGD